MTHFYVLNTLFKLLKSLLTDEVQNLIKRNENLMLNGISEKLYSETIGLNQNNQRKNN